MVLVLVLPIQKQLVLPITNYQFHQYLRRLCISPHLQYAHASVLLYTFMREIQKYGNVILGTRWN